MYIGLIKWFNIEQGYGVIATNFENIEVFENENKKIYPTDNQIFLHIRNWKDPETVNPSLVIPVIYDIAFERNKLSAHKCKYLGNNQVSWRSLFYLLGTREIILIEDRNSIKEINVIEYAFNSLNENFDPIFLKESLIQAINDIFENNQFEKSATIFKIYKESNNHYLRQHLEECFETLYPRLNSKQKLEFWEKENIPDQFISLLDFEDNIHLINKEILERLRLQESLSTGISKLLRRKLDILSATFSYNEFLEFEFYLEFIDDKKHRTEIELELNRIAKSEYVKAFYENLSEIGRIENGIDLDKIKYRLKSIPTFINEDVRTDIKLAIEFFIQEHAEFEAIVEAAISGFFFDPQSVILKDIHKITKPFLEQIINSADIFDNEFKKKIIYELADGESNLYVLESAKTFSDPDFFKEIDIIVFNKTEQSEYFEVWQEKLGEIIPHDYLLTYFDDISKKYENIKSWLSIGIINQHQITNILVTKLNSISHIVKDRNAFHTIFNIIQFLVDFDIKNVKILNKFKNSFYDLILWYLDIIDSFDYNLLKGKFIFFNPDQQVRIIKKLFKLKAQGIIELNIAKLDEIVRADLDLFLANEKFNSEIVLDLSTDVIIQALKKFSETGKFLVESDLLTIVLEDIGVNKTKKFQIEDYFDKCPGRMKVKYSGGINGTIKTRNFGNNKFYFVIEFRYDKDLVNAVHQIPGSKFNKVETHWGVPSAYKNEVLNFAKRFNFLIQFEGSEDYNDDLTSLERNEIPHHIRFCSGQISQNKDRTFHKKFWWCANEPCFGNIEIIHSPDDWEEYTLLDFINILEFSVVENNNYGYSEIGLYNQFISQINRFNQLLEKLYCRSCGQILYPVESAALAAYTVTRFNCLNNSCSNNGTVIYLNHCLNAKCNEIIDSRDSHQCPNGLYICKSCGGCCSHSMFERRLANLERAGRKNYDLRKKVQENEGHLERAEYYCHSCGNMMNEKSSEVFICKRCNVKYETSKYWLDRKFTHLRRNDYPVG